MNNPIINLLLTSKSGVFDIPCSKHVNRCGCKRGYTLIELFIVMAIIATLVAIAVPSYLRYRYKAMVVVAVSDIRMIEKQISLYTQENGGQLPNSLSDLTTIKNVKDPWGRPYQYLRIDGGNKTKTDTKVRRNMSDNPVNTDFDLYSIGNNGLSKPQFKFKVSQDDIVRAYNGQYVGLVSEL